MARAQVREVSQEAAIKGVAAPVNTYVRPADPAPSPLHQLADALGTLGDGLSAYQSKGKEKRDRDAKQRAIKDATMGAAPGYNEGTKRGLIPAQDNDEYIRWHKTQRGVMRGRELESQFALRYQTWEGRNSGDPEAYKAFTQEFLQENLADENDPEVLAGLNPYIDNILNNGMANFTTDRDKHLRSEALSTSGAIAADDIADGVEAARASGEEIDQDALFTFMMANRQEALLRNDADEYDKMLVDTILLKAEEEGDADIIKLLDRKFDGKDYVMSSDPAVKEKIISSMGRINSANASAETRLAAKQEKEDKARHEALVADTLQKIDNDPEFVVPEETLKEISRRDGEFRSKLPGYRKNLEGDGTPEDEIALMDLYSEIDQGKGKDFVREARRMGIIKSVETFNKALDRVDKVAAANKEGGVFTSPTFKDMKKQIINATGTGEASVFDGVKGMTTDGMRATQDYSQQMLAWATENPDLANNTAAREKAAFEIGNSILSRVTVNPDASYETPEQQRANQAGTYPDPATAAPPEAAVDPATQEPIVPGAPPAAVAAARQTMIDELAKKHGVTPEVAAQVLLDQESQVAVPAEVPVETPEVDPSLAPALAPPEGASLINSALDAPAEDPSLLGGMVDNLKKDPWEGRGPLKRTWDYFFGKDEEQTPEEAAAAEADPLTTNSILEYDKNKLTALLDNPPMKEDGTSYAGNAPTKPILDLLGKTEGTDKGDGYNETLSYGAFTGGDVNLVGMTLDEIDQLQTAMLSHPDNSWDSSAVGRYQIVRKTMRAIRTQMGLSGDEKYDEAMQDKMAMHLLRGRGLDRWISGDLSDNDFMDSLAKEWASLPKADGKGNYPKQRAATDVQSVLKSLGAFKQGSGTGEPPAVYSKIPVTDSAGEDQIAKFVEWNSDPVANHEANLKTLDPKLQDVINLAQIKGGKFVIGSALRDEEMQEKAVKWGWSKTKDSDHLDGGAVDLWPLDEDGAVVFTPEGQQAIITSMKAAAKALGVTLDIGGEWKSFKDMPHFAIKTPAS